MFLSTPEGHITRRSRHHALSAHHVPLAEHIVPKTKKQSIGLLSFLVAGRGFEPPDLRVMSPTSYQAALPRDILFYHMCGAGDRSRTGTILSYHGILSPGRLPIPPHRHSWTTVMDSRIGSQKLLYHNYYPLSTPFFHFYKKYFHFSFFY